MSLKLIAEDFMLKNRGSFQKMNGTRQGSGMRMSAFTGVLAIALLSGCAATRYEAETVDTSQDRLPILVAANAKNFQAPEWYPSVEAGRYSESEALLKRTLEATPHDPYALLAMGVVMERTGRIYQASTYYQSALQYGTQAPLGATLSMDDDDPMEDAQTIADLARANLDRIL